MARVSVSQQQFALVWRRINESRKLTWIFVLIVILASLFISLALGTESSILPKDFPSALSIVLTYYLITFIFALLFVQIGTGLTDFHNSLIRGLKQSVTPAPEGTVSKLLRIYLPFGIMINLTLFPYLFLLPTQSWLSVVSQLFSPLGPAWQSVAQLLQTRLGPTLNLVALIAVSSIGPTLLFLLRRARKGDPKTLDRVISFTPFVIYLSILIWVLTLSQSQTIPDATGYSSLSDGTFWLFVERFFILVMPSTTLSSSILAMIDESHV